MALISGRQLAKELGLTEGAIRKMRDLNQITPAIRAKGKSGTDRYDLEEVKRQREQNVRQRPDESSGTIVKLQASKLAEEIKAKRLENARRRGELRPVAEMRAFLNGLIVAARNIFVGIHDQPHIGLDARQREAVRVEIERGLGEMQRAHRSLQVRNA